MTTDNNNQIFLLTPTQNRAFIIVLYKAGQLTWAEAFKRLYNAGFRGRQLRMDR